MNQPQRMPGRFFKAGNDARKAQRNAVESRRANRAYMIQRVTPWLRAHVPAAMADLILARVPLTKLYDLLPDGAR